MIFSSDSNLLSWRRVVGILYVSAAVLGLTAAPAAWAVTLKIATLSPEGSGWMKVLRKHAGNIEQRTDGAVKFKFFPGGVMGDDKAVLRKIRVGQLHGAVLTSGSLAQNYQDIALYNLPMLFQNAQEVDYVRTRLDQRLMSGLRENKFVGFGFAEVGFAFPMTQREATSVGSLRQQKVWSPDNDPASLQAFDAFKITPIPLPIADVLTGLQTGLIDSVAAPPIGTIALQWHTQVKYGLELPLMYVYGLFTIAERPFNRLNAEQQAIVSEELRAAVKAVDQSARQDSEKAYTALGQVGVQWLQPTTEERQQWLTLAEQARSAIVADGHLDGGLYQELTDLLAAYRAGL